MFDYRDSKVKALLFTLFALLCFCLQSNRLHSVEPSRILYLIQTGNLCTALELYKKHREEMGEHDLELVQKIGLLLLDQGFRSSDPDIRLLTLFGSGISLNEHAQYILEEGIKTNLPQFQLVSLNFLSKFQNDDANEMINRAMSSDALGIRLEAAFLLAEMKHPKASGQIESLMQKVVPELLPLFPQLLAMAGDADSIRTLQRLLTNPIDNVRIEAIHSAAKYGRDDLLPDIRRLSTHLHVAQQEACAVAFGILKDENSLPRLRFFMQSNVVSVQLATLQALYRLGREEVRHDIERIAKEENVFAINILGEMEGSEPLLYELTKSKNIHTRINAALALLELRDPKCLPALCEVLIKDSRDLAFVKQHTYGKGLSAWKVTPSAQHNLTKEPIALELSLHMREAVLEKTLELPEIDFLRLAHTLFEVRQNDLAPLLSRLLENLQTSKAIELLKYHRKQVGAPLIRNYCNLVLYRLKEPGPYSATMQEWLTSKQFHDLIQFRPIIPWEMRNNEPSRYLLTPEETSRLLVEAFESLVQTQDDKAIDILLHAIQYGNRKNRYALAGLLIRATN